MTSPRADDDLDQESAEDIDLLALARALWLQRVRIVGIPLVVGVLTLGISFLIPPTFTASTTLIPPQQAGSSALSALAGQLGALGGLAGVAGAVKTSGDQYVSFLSSRNVSDRIIEKFKLRDMYETPMMTDARLALAGNVRVSLGKKDGLLSIEVDDHDPARAAAIANAYVDELKRVISEFAVGEAAQRRVFFEAQMKTAQQSLADAESALGRSGISPTALNTSPQSAVAGVARLRASITAQEVKIASLRGYATEDNPDLRQANLQLAALQAQLTQAEAGDTNSPRSKYLELYRAFKYQESLYELMVKQYELARIDEARDGSVVQVLDPAIVPERKSKPKKAMIAIAAMAVAAFATIGFFAARHLWTLRSREQPGIV